MKNYYLMVHFDGGAVTGFMAFGVNSEEEARKQVIKALLKRKNSIPVEDPYGKRKRVCAYLKALNKHWRFTGKGKSTHRFYSSSPNIEYMEFTDQAVEAWFCGWKSFKVGSITVI